MTHHHQVTLDEQADRVRGICTCSWTSPWATTGPAWPDVPPRPPEQVVGTIVRAADWHLRHQGGDAT